ncbi:MAG: hypothetical protein H5U08_12260 [Thermogutta sp.]|uniref:hypothetical protein n=1 Tax=Thermogutta sp. TaxID=1962930 RepID=UPI00199B338A|nr:hypothetical protein [Thermogutta sp.]MBC7353125.1 hypothetical protein [Thermogutta sp.]
METAKQVSVKLVNKPGRLAQLLDALAKAKVRCRALVVMDSGDRGTVRFVPTESERAIKVVEQLNLPYEVADVLLVDVPKQPGGFRKICERLAEHHLNIDYAYHSFGTELGAKGGGVAVVKVNDLSKAQRVLSNNESAGKQRVSVRRPVYAR